MQSQKHALILIGHKPKNMSWSRSSFIFLLGAHSFDQFEKCVLLKACTFTSVLRRVRSEKRKVGRFYSVMVVLVKA
jgi:hypothetical protein